MKTIKRRDVLKTAAAMVAGGAASGAMPVQGQGAGRTPFAVPPTFIPIAGTDQLFPVRRIYCIGRNYAAHAREMGSDPTREPPFFFQKPTDAIQIVPPGETVDHPYPTLTKNYHYEIELVAALNKGGRNVPIDRALELVYGYTVGTRHDPARPAARDGRREEAVGDRQELRPFGGTRTAAAGDEDRPFHAGRDLAQGERPVQAECQPQPDDLERSPSRSASSPRRSSSSPAISSIRERPRTSGRSCRATSWTGTSRGCRTSGSRWSDSARPLADT